MKDKQARLWLFVDLVT